MTPGESVELLLVLAAVAVFVVVIVLLLKVAPGQGGPRTTARAPEPLQAPPDERPIPAVVVNPTKFDDLAALRTRISRRCTDLGWDPPLWLETTEDDPGVGQAREAVSRGADVVMACGGDGTARCVAEALAGTGVAMGLLPAGTGNLLARNLGLQWDGFENAAEVALTGDDRPVDVGRMSVDGDGTDRVFLVMAGMGFVAQIMSDVPEALKARVGPVAYTVAGLRQLKGRQVRVRLAVDDEEEVPRRVRTIVVGNCGKLQGGLALMPGAEIDDGWLDMVAIAPEGVVGWVAVAGRVITKQRRGHRRVEHWRAKAFTITAEQPQPAQLDGDPIGDVRSLSMRVDPGALIVRVPPLDDTPARDRAGLDGPRSPSS